MRLAIGVMVLVGLMGASVIVGFMLSSADQNRLRQDRYATRELRIFLQALVDAETGVRGFVLSGQADYLEPYIDGMRVLDERGQKALKALAHVPSAMPEDGSFAAALTALRRAWTGAIALADRGDLSAAQSSLIQQRAKPLMDTLRRIISTELDERNATAEEAEHRIALEQSVLLIINPAGAIIALVATGFAFWRSGREAQAREAAQQEMQSLFEMTEMLQSAGSRDDANEVLRATAHRLLPGFSGALYVFNNSRDRLDLSTSWGGAEDAAPPDHIGPHTCWALKRGKPHVNDAAAGLACAHASLGAPTLEIPMAARGEIYGLLQIAPAHGAQADRLPAIRPLATALGDAMSLSLSSNALRDRLRNQALRDALTGLYNRRFLDEMLDRLTQDAQRRGASLAAIMIDLDHFKRLNDQFGHAAGDAVLQEVGRAIMTDLRASDLACRYGGEELLVLLPECATDEAAAKAERLRLRIKELGGSSVGQPVTASLGVATLPGSAATGAELLSAADGALYRAKQEGRDRVALAPARGTSARVSLVVAKQGGDV